jgi:release factor glutamine methyltransferase
VAQIDGVTVWQWYQGLSTEVLAAEWLLSALTDVDKLSLRLGTLIDRPSIQLDRPWPEILDLWQQYLEQRVPMQYLVGTTPWRDWELQVSPAVLIPRPETELIIDIVLEHTSAASRSGHWLDLGTGSGAIAIGLAAALPQATIHAVDYSDAALAIARQNIINAGLIDRIQLYQGSWWQPLAYLSGQVMGMVSNPPYIPTSLVAGLQPEVALHEPHLALDGGEDGLVAIRELVNHAPDFLVADGLWLVEMMAGQGVAVLELLEQQGQYRDIQIINDWAGFDRFVVAWRRLD